jgi:hypothetical protein
MKKHKIAICLWCDHWSVIVTIVIAVVCVVGSVVLFWKLFFSKHPRIIVYLIIVGTAVVDDIVAVSFIGRGNHRLAVSH